MDSLRKNKVRFKRAISLMPFFCALYSFGLFGQSLCWEISGNGLKKPSYLYGTIHIGDKRVFDLGKAWDCFNNAEVFLMEINPDSANSASILEFFKLDSGKTLKDLFSAEDFERVEGRFQEKLGISIIPFLGYRPFFIISLLEQSKFSNEMGIALDLYLFNRAKKMGKEVFGIETVEEQVRAVLSFSDSLQAKWLLESLEESKEMTMVLKKMLKYYLKGDLENLKMKMDDTGMEENFEEVLLIKRNELMAERVSPILIDKSCFIAVGAGHLTGETGLIALFQKKGFVVKPVKM